MISLLFKSADDFRDNDGTGRADCTKLDKSSLGFVETGCTRVWGVGVCVCVCVGTLTGPGYLFAPCNNGQMIQQSALLFLSCTHLFAGVSGAIY